MTQLKIMEVVTTSNLVSSKTEKTACNFQTMVINFFVVPHDLMRGQIGSYADMLKKICEKAH